MKKQKTFAQRAKDIEKMFKDRFDSVSQRTKNEMMADLRDEQEALKASMEIQQPQQPMQGEQPNQAMFGALLGPALGAAGAAGGAGAVAGATGASALGAAAPNFMGQLNKVDGAGAAFDTAGASNRAAAGLTGDGATSPAPGGGGSPVRKYLDAGIGAINTITGNPDYDTSGQVRFDEDAEKDRMKNEGITSGVSAVSKFASGDVLGGALDVAKGLGSIFNKKGLNKMKAANSNADLKDAAGNRPDSYGVTQPTNKSAMGGKVNQYGLGSWLFGKSQEGEDGEMGSRAGKGLDWLDKNAGNIAQYATALGPLTQKFEGAETPKGTRLYGKTSLDRLDEQELLNQLKGSVNVNTMAKEGSGGSLSAYNTGARVGNKQLLEAIGKTGAGVRQSNLEQGNREEQINLQERMTNMAADERFLEREAKDKGALSTAKQANRAAIFENIGNIGREEGNKKIVKEMYGYKWDGTYVKDDSGNIVTNDEGLPMTKEEWDTSKQVNSKKSTTKKTKG
jgi:hypothetical protein